jgi:hypothetical protein
MWVKMDLERAIEFLLERQAAREAWSDAQQVRFDQQQAQFRADFEERQKQSEQKHEREIGAIRAELRRGVRLAVEEARRERKRCKEEDAKLALQHAELADSHSALEKSIQRFIDSLKQPRNGHDKT